MTRPMQIAIIAAAIAALTYIAWPDLVAWSRGEDAVMIVISERQAP